MADQNGTGVPALTRLSWLIPAGVLSLLVVGIYLGRGWWFPRAVDYSATARGSPEYAATWRDRLTPLADPDEATARYPDQVVAVRFPNGEWVFGVCHDSHTNPDGGSVVVKDSTGRVRAFFGHVCGSAFLAQFFESSKSLSEFYGSGSWEQFGFCEYPVPGPS